MSPTRQTLHSLVDLVDNNEIDIIYRILMKFVPEDEATPDEIEAMKVAEIELANGETVRHEDINWD